VLPVVVFLPLPAALTPLLYNHLPKSKYPITHNRVTTQMFQRITDAEREREFTEAWPFSSCILPA
jgi:hypothetical protein